MKRAFSHFVSNISGEMFKIKDADVLITIFLCVQLRAMQEKGVLLENKNSVFSVFVALYEVFISCVLLISFVLKLDYFSLCWHSQACLRPSYLKSQNFLKTKTNIIVGRHNIREKV